MSRTLPSITDVYEAHGLYLQTTGFSCGPASLVNAMRICRPGTSVTEQDLIAECGAQPGSGTANEDLERAARGLGLEVVEARPDMTNRQLRRHVANGDCVVVNYCMFPGSGHYSIVSECDEHGVLLWDCSYGLVRIGWKRFGSIWVSGEDEPGHRWALVVR